ncbi:calcium/calmodulin-dependent protein kinase kinase 2 beta isoform 3 [Planoprotostelium fungivorum]|uniref:non-specific serine/threonine protein kinase n=1 Tax=Planoprotostelium fungivorum TaxID=1890364 RepID=A0A2P6NTN0_9EUKA|nr:calcium/calmodulin-dependent protein kinase kinase 2 beta isoform 3 [Planoprotostelium fungivorum]
MNARLHHLPLTFPLPMWTDLMQLVNNSGASAETVASIMEEHPVLPPVRLRVRSSSSEPLPPSQSPKSRMRRDETSQVTAYLQSHKIELMFQNLASSIMFHRPEDPRRFLLKELRQMQTKKWSNSEDMKHSIRDLPGLTKRPSSSNLRVDQFSTTSEVREHAPVRSVEKSNISFEPAPSQTHDHTEQVEMLRDTFKKISLPQVTRHLSLATEFVDKSGGKFRPSRSVDTSPCSSPAHSPTYGGSRSSSPKSGNIPTSPSSVWSTESSSSRDDKGYLHVNQYIILSTIGRGMYGKVKLAEDTITGAKFAVKVLRKQRLKRMRRLRPGKISDALQDLREEIAIMKKLNHPNIIKLYEVLEDTQSDKLYMVLELASEGQVMSLREDGTTVTRLDSDTAWKYFRDLIAALEYLHHQNIIHRDIKPENLLVTHNKTLKICDFGVAQSIENSAQTLTGSQGSPAFLAPEILVGSKKAFRGKPLDIWAAGVSLYCFVFGRVPFRGKNYLDLTARVHREELSFPEDISSELKDLLSRMIEKEPTMRIPLKDIRVHDWVTKRGTAPLPEYKHEEVTVTEEEISGAIKNIDTLRVLMKTKMMARPHFGRGHPILILTLLMPTQARCWWKRSGGEFVNHKVWGGSLSASLLNSPAEFETQEQNRGDRESMRLEQEQPRGRLSSIKTLRERSSSIELAQTSEGVHRIVHKLEKRESQKHLAESLMSAGKTLKHPNIPTMVDSYETVSHWNFIFEYTPGDSLESMLKTMNGPAPETLLQPLFKQLVKAIRHSHKRGTAHMDLRPDNILIQANGDVKVIDWELSCRTSKRDPCRLWVGSPDYAAPEILLHTPYDPLSADVWSLGVILYLSVVGRLPFEAADRKKGIVRGAHPSFRWNNDIHSASSSLVHLLECMLQVDPKKRATIEEVSKHKWLKDTKGTKKRRSV